MLILMFIGGSSGSLAGGVKITTVFVLIYYVWRSIFNKDINISHYLSSKAQIRKSILVFISSLILLIFFSLIMFTSETTPIGFGLEYVLVEVFSTFGTVGITMGLSLHLSLIGKIVSIFLMFVGRIGLITFILSLGKYNSQKAQASGFPDAHIVVG